MSQNSDKDDAGLVRLQRFLSQSGVASRRAAEKLMLEGVVKVNGKVASELGTKVDPAKDAVTVHGRRVRPEEHLYWMLNKPKGYVTTTADPQGRRTVMELLPDDLAARLVPVGRLDYYTEGVLLFTNDGDLSFGLLHPKGLVDKTYHVKLKGKVATADIERLRAGVKLDDGEVTAPAEVDLIPDEESKTLHHTWLQITIREGRSRQIHRMAEAIGHDVLKLARIGFAGLNYYGLRMGESRPLTDAEVSHLKRLAAAGRGEDAEGIEAAGKLKAKGRGKGTGKERPEGKSPRSGTATGTGTRESTREPRPFGNRPSGRPEGAPRAKLSPKGRPALPSKPSQVRPGRPERSERPGRPGRPEGSGGPRRDPGGRPLTPGGRRR